MIRHAHDAPGGPRSAAVPRAASRKLLRGAVNLWLAWHLAALIIAPASVAPSSELVRSAWTLFQPYLQALYLNNGYHFFAPEPSDSALVAFAARRDDGSVVRGRIPDRRIGPRLLYHRHFMLTERLAAAPPELQQPWRTSYARHCGRVHGATQVSLTGLTHHLPTMEMVRHGVHLDDPGSYEEEPLGDFRCDAF
jgi:hypothetical protein